MNNWIVIIPLAAFIVLAYAIAAAIGSRRGYQHGEKEFHADYRALQVDHGVAVAKADGMEQGRDYARAQRDKLNGENDALHKHVEIMAESLNVAQAEVERLLKSADHATIPLADAVKPEPPKRPTRKKAGTP